MFSLWAQIREGSQKGEWVACWYFDDWETGKAYARQRCHEVLDGVILIKDEGGIILEKVY